MKKELREEQRVAWKHRCFFRSLSIFLAALVLVILWKTECQFSAERVSQTTDMAGTPLRLAVIGLVHGHVQGF